MKPTIFAPFLSAAALAACNSLTSPINTAPPPPRYASFTSQGDSATVAGTLAAFRLALGGSLNAPNTPPADSGRREINWDGVPAALTNVDTFPLGFFNANSKRGAVMLTPGSGIRIDSTAFVSIDSGLAAQFKAFSPKKLFMAVGSNQVAVDFKVVGTDTSGVVTGFGVVFSDVDLAGSTHVEFFDSTGLLLADLAAPAQLGAQGFSFVGAVFESALVARVVITSGEAALASGLKDLSAGGSKDLVVMDDFVYGEPQH